MNKWGLLRFLFCFLILLLEGTVPGAHNDFMIKRAIITFRSYNVPEIYLIDFKIIYYFATYYKDLSLCIQYDYSI